MIHKEVIDTIRQTGFETHVYFKNGFLEKIYENALVNRLGKKGLKVYQQFPIRVYDEDGYMVGEYIADIVVNDTIIVEVKAVKLLSEIHTAQVLAYLKASSYKHGVLMNFGSPKFQIRKYIL